MSATVVSQEVSKKIPKWSRRPTASEIAAFDGLHCYAAYHRSVQSGWRCPCCNRSAHELIRWSEIRGRYWRARYADEHGMGFTIAFARHHDHGAERWPHVSRFPDILICGDCNSADGAAKRKLGLPKYFSFSAGEIRQFAHCCPHSGRTSIDYQKALALYRDLAAEEC